MSQQQLKANGLKTLEAFIAEFEDKQSALIKVLYEAQHIFDCLSRDIMLFISDKLGVPASKIYGMVSFYSHFTTELKGRAQIKVYMGTACFVRGAQSIVNRLESQLGLRTRIHKKYSSYYMLLK